MKATGELQGISFPAPDMQSFGYSIIIQFLIVRLTTLSAIVLRLLDYIVTISFGYILYCVCFNLFCNVWVCNSKLQLTRCKVA